MSDFLNNTPELWMAKLPLPNKESHKHNRGHLLISGSREMTGASRLSARGARRMGCGLVYLAVPHEVAPIYMTDSPSNIVLRSEDSGAFRSAIRKSQATAILVGPGMKESDTTREIIQRALHANVPTLIDAGGIGVFTNKPERLKKAITNQAVITPHMGEYEKLFGSDNKTAAQKALDMAKYLKATVVLKGSETYIATYDGRVAKTETANPWLAIGGTGDVLSGQIAALLAQGMDSFLAACAGVWFHRQAAEIIGVGLVAEDIPEHLMHVWKELLKD
ncbi:MAG: NAD(P)H-hydrate dehydratase [Alphaproteobacteria bacterium]